MLPVSAFQPNVLTVSHLDRRTWTRIGDFETVVRKARRNQCQGGKSRACSADTTRAGLQARIDRHFDRIAELAQGRAEARPEVRPDASLDAYAVLDHLARLRGEIGALAAGLARSEADLAETGRRAREVERELSALQATKAWRLLAPARELYARLRWSAPR